MASETEGTIIAVEDVTTRLDQLSPHDLAFAVKTLDHLIKSSQLEEAGEYDRWTEERDRMELEVGVSVQWLADELWDLRMRGLVSDSRVASFDEQSLDARTWRVVPTGGEDRGMLTFAEAIEVVRALKEDCGSIDPFIAVALEEAVAEGWIDSYDHANVDGTAIYRITARRGGEVVEWHGDTLATRGALWAMTVMALREHGD